MNSMFYTALPFYHTLLCMSISSCKKIYILCKVTTYILHGQKKQQLRAESTAVKLTHRKQQDTRNCREQCNTGLCSAVNPRSTVHPAAQRRGRTFAPQRPRMPYTHSNSIHLRISRLGVPLAFAKTTIPPWAPA